MTRKTKPPKGPDLGPAIEILRLARTTKRIPDNLKVLEALSHLEEGYYSGFDRIARMINLNRSRVRILARRLARKGLTEYSAGLFNSDGTVAGAGYALTARGRTVLQIISENDHDLSRD